MTPKRTDGGPPVQSVKSLSGEQAGLGDGVVVSAEAQDEGVLFR
jgi:hypothetical protein